MYLIKLMAFSIALPLLAAAAPGDLTEHEQLKRSFKIEGNGEAGLVIDNIWGAIKVTKVNSKQVVVKVNKTIRADNQRELNRAREDVSLDISQSDNRIRFFVDGPFRVKRGMNITDENYIVKYDFEVEVPERLKLVLKTVNEGDINVSGDITGDFSIRNVNGSITVDGISGSGVVSTVNGPVKVRFTEPPNDGCAFKTINGDVEVSFPGDLSADMNCKTFNGEIYSDFDVSPLPSATVKSNRKGGMTRIQSGGTTNLRIAAGGPVLKFDTLNGDILIRNR